MNIEAFLSAKDRITYARFNPIEKAKEYLAIRYKSGDLLDYDADAYMQDVKIGNAKDDRENCYDKTFQIRDESSVKEHEKVAELPK